MIRFSLRTKLLLFIIGATVLIFAPSIGYLGLVNKDDYYNIGKKDIGSEVKRYSIEIEKKINDYFSIIRTLASVNSTIDEYNNSENPEQILNNYKKILLKNKNIDGVWDSWEFLKTNEEGIDEIKRRSLAFERIGTKIISSVEIEDLSKGYLEIVEQKSDEAVMEPYLYSFTRRKEDECLVTSLSVKMFNKQKRLGIVGVDIKLSNIQNLINSIDLTDNSRVVELLSAKANYLSSKDETLIGKNSNIQDSIYDILRVKGNYSQIINIDGEDIYRTYSKIQIGKTNDFWVLVFSVPKSKIQEQAVNNLRLTFIIGVVGLLLLGVFIVLITVPLTAPIFAITKRLKFMAKGEIDKVKRVETKRKDELGEMTQAMNMLGDSLTEKTKFAEQIGNGELVDDFNLLSDDDTLGKALVTMRNNLNEAKRLEEEYKVEDKKRQWANKGYAFFAELLRKNNENLEKLNNEIIKNVVKYVGVNQGGIFLQDKNDDNFINLVAAYAYDRKKYLESKIEKGEGLVGTCYIEAKNIYLTDIPDNYMNITSGLGDANPTSLLLVPLKNEDEVIGVMEIASFKEFEKYQIEFIEKLASTIASTIITVENNERTKLLLEQTNQQAEEMRSQEEEMRQNMEELIATQEESEKKSSEARELFSALNTANYVIECSIDGEISFISSSYSQLLNTDPSIIIGKQYISLLYIDDTKVTEFSELWNRVVAGNVEKIVTTIRINGNDFKMYKTFMPIKNDDEKVEKIIIIANDLNKFKEL